MKAPPSTKKQEEAKPPKKQVSDWWFNSGIIERPKLPISSTTAEGKRQKQGWASETLLHYLMSHALLDDIRRFLSDGTLLARRAAPKKQPHIDFFTACRDPDRRVLAPLPASEELQPGSSTFKPFHCLRHLALIEMVDKTFTDLPIDHNTLLQELATHRANEESQCQTLDGMQKAAELRLIAYSKVDDNDFANARFLDLKEPVGEGAAAATSLRKMVKDLHDAFEKQAIDMTIFKPNHFATLAVYYAKFLIKDSSRTRNWINRRYCNGLRQYVPGNEIEPDAVRQEHLASQCMPQHYDDSGVPQPAGLEQAGQAIASAPVTCELCHVGFSGLDKFTQHCRRCHKSVAEYRNYRRPSSR